MAPISNRVVINAVLRAAGRSTATVHGEMERGVDNLATIASVAPLLGLLITTQGIVGSFVGCGGERSACTAAIMERISNAITPVALGLIVGIIALWFYRYLRGELEHLHVEMRNVTLELANALSALPRQTDGNHSPGA